MNCFIIQNYFSEIYPFYLATELHAVGHICVSILLLICTEIDNYMYFYEMKLLTLIL